MQKSFQWAIFLELNYKHTSDTYVGDVTYVCALLIVHSMLMVRVLCLLIQFLLFSIHMSDGGVSRGLPHSSFTKI